MKHVLLLLLMGLGSIGRQDNRYSRSDLSLIPVLFGRITVARLPEIGADTSKNKKPKETVITSVIHDTNGGTVVKEAQIFDSDKQAGLINVMIMVRDVDTRAPLIKIVLKAKDAKTGQEFESEFSAADKGYRIKVQPETVVSIYVTARGYTDASANINDIKHDRSLAFELQKIKPSLVKIKVVDAATERPIAASTLTIKSKTGGTAQTLPLKEGVKELTYDTPEDLEMTASAAGYSSVNKSLSVETALNGKTYEFVAKLERATAPPAPVAVTPPSTPAAPSSAEKTVETKTFGTLEKGKAITLNNIYFDQSSPVLRETSSKQLDELLDVMKQNPSIRVEIRGHTDNAGDFDLNVKLSRERCQSVADYLIQKGINAGRLQTVGRGPVDPVAPNTTEENRKKNRRVEFIVL